VSDAPWFEDFKVGDRFDDVPSVTITEAHAVVHQAIFGDRLKLPLDHELGRRVTGSERPIVNPSLVCNIAIGQSTIPSQRVMGNLFYRGLVLRRPVYVGDTLSTRTGVVALKQNRIREGRAASGMVALEIDVRNQRDESVMLFWRCPMIPCRDPEARTGHDDSFDLMPEDIDREDLLAAVPDWKLDLLASDSQKLEVGETVEVSGRDTVTLAPELARMTLNLAMTHTDAARSVYGKRLVYGGHTISTAAAQLSRVVPSLATILGWYRCDHVAPVFEQDILKSDVTLVDRFTASAGEIGVVRVETYADRGPEAPEEGEDIQVLAWQLAVLMAGGV
jgi:acyl dehydratase